MSKLSVPERRDLFQFLLPKNKITKIYDIYDRIDTLETFTDNRFRVWSNEAVGSYEGEHFAIIQLNVFPLIWVIWRDFFGSCESCDGFIGETFDNQYNYIKNTLSEGNTIQFKTLKEAKEWIINPDDKTSWKGFSLELFDIVFIDKKGLRKLTPEELENEKNARTKSPKGA
jgi:hypothetical protein